MAQDSWGGAEVKRENPKQTPHGGVVASRLDPFVVVTLNISCIMRDLIRKFFYWED